MIHALPVLAGLQYVNIYEACRTSNGRLTSRLQYVNIYDICFTSNGRLTSRLQYVNIYDTCFTSNGRLTSRRQYVNMIHAVPVMAGCASVGMPERAICRWLWETTSAQPS